jgi:hypothetical protein
LWDRLGPGHADTLHHTLTAGQKWSSVTAARAEIAQFEGKFGPLLEGQPFSLTADQPDAPSCRPRVCLSRLQQTILTGRDGSKPAFSKSSGHGTAIEVDWYEPQALKIAVQPPQSVLLGDRNRRIVHFTHTHTRVRKTWQAPGSGIEARAVHNHLIDFCSGGLGQPPVDQPGSSNDRTPHPRPASVDKIDDGLAGDWNCRDRDQCRKTCGREIDREWIVDELYAWLSRTFESAKRCIELCRPG